jgi:hypothetical protein
MALQSGLSCLIHARGTDIRDICSRDRLDRAAGAACADRSGGALTTVKLSNFGVSAAVRRDVGEDAVSLASAIT